MSDWLTKPVVTSEDNVTTTKAKLNEEDNNDNEWLKLQAKQARQNLKMQCVQIANRTELNADEIVKQAKILYAFVRT